MSSRENLRLATAGPMMSAEQQGRRGAPPLSGSTLADLRRRLELPEPLVVDRMSPCTPLMWKAELHSKVAAPTVYCDGDWVDEVEW